MQFEGNFIDCKAIEDAVTLQLSNRGLKPLGSRFLIFLMSLLVTSGTMFSNSLLLNLCTYFLTCL